MGKIRSFQIAKKSNISAGFLSEIINGKKRPSYRIAKKIAIVVGISPILLLEGTPKQIRAAFERFKKLKSKSKGL